MTRVTSFIKQFTAILNGDDAAATAHKAWRQAEAALKVRIATMDAETIAKEEAVHAAKEAADKCLINNGQCITDSDLYTKSIVESDNALKVAQKNLENHLKTLEFFKNKLTELRTEVSLED